jgi:hypothetical protein
VYHVVLILLAAVLMMLAWQLVHYSPRVLSVLLPAKLTFIVGLVLLVLSFFGAFCAAYMLNSPEGVIGCFVQVYVGLWFMCATSAAARGSEADERLLRRVFAVLGMMMVMILATLYVPDPQFVSLFNLLMIAGCFWVTANYFQIMDRGR